MKFVASSEDSIVIVEAPTEWDARQFACAELGVGEPTIRLVPEAGGPFVLADAEVKWFGTDAGRLADRHIEIRRAMKDGAWGPWRRRQEDATAYAKRCAKDPPLNGGM